MSLFKRPSWAQVSPSADHEETEKDIFSHSERVFKEVTAEKLRQRELELKEKNKEKGNTEVKNELQQTPLASRTLPERDSSSKRRRITAEEKDDLLRSLGLAHSPREVDDEDEHSRSPVRETSPRPTKAQPSAAADMSTRPNSGMPSNVIEILDDSEEEPEVTVSRTDGAASVPETAKPLTREDVEEEDSDPEIAALQRQARQRRLQPASSQSNRTPTIQPSTSVPDPIDPVINLFISSPIPNTQPLLVHCRLSQRLQDVRENWCQRQPFSSSFAETVFLIHRMHRVYNVTTGRSLGLAVDETTGRITKKGAEGKDGVENVHLEAVTEEIFQQMKLQRSSNSNGRGHAFDLDDDDDDDNFGNDRGGSGEGGQVSAVATETRQQIRITLRAKDRNELKIKVQPTTTVAKLVQACRGEWGVAETDNVWLEFDGDRLDPDAEMQETEVEDLVTVDVYIR